MQTVWLHLLMNRLEYLTQEKFSVCDVTTRLAAEETLK